MEVVSGNGSGVHFGGGGGAGVGATSGESGFGFGPAGTKKVGSEKYFNSTTPFMPHISASASLQPGALAPPSAAALA